MTFTVTLFHSKNGPPTYDSSFQSSKTLNVFLESISDLGPFSIHIYICLFRQSRNRPFLHDKCFKISDNSYQILYEFLRLIIFVLIFKHSKLIMVLSPFTMLHFPL